MRALSILTGSSEETLHNARAEMSHNFGRGVLSNQSEKNYVFETLIDYMPRYFTPEQIRSMYTGHVTGFIVEDLAQSKKNEKFIQIFNRVMVYFYDYEFGNVSKLEPALLRMGEDFEQYVQRYIR